MSHTATFDDVWKLFQETAAQMRETDRLVKENTAQMRETDRKFQETERLVKENAAQMRETYQRLRETDRLVKDVSRQVGNLTGKWGQFVENLVAPGCQTLFAERGIPVHQVYQRVKANLDDGRTMEIDILVVNTGAVVLVEVKSTLTVADVRDHLDRLGQFKAFFPRYRDCRVMGAVAGITTEEDAGRFAKKQGLFVMVQSGENVVLANEPGFQPKTW
ncbi:MAG: DUF3782 domain-containing protein [Nitrospirae bacterium]|nr:DUF3782 domain-containing protein [Magnetococcales bacterium]HAT48922.1 DUF3782 domain-containing protein [Alphaproteobacteria bacterium]